MVAIWDACKIRKARLRETDMRERTHSHKRTHTHAHKWQPIKDLVQRQWSRGNCNGPSGKPIHGQLWRFCDAVNSADPSLAQPLSRFGRFFQKQKKKQELVQKASNPWSSQPVEAYWSKLAHLRCPMRHRHRLSLARPCLKRAPTYSRTHAHAQRASMCVITLRRRSTPKWRHGSKARVV